MRWNKAGAKGSEWMDLCAALILAERAGNHRDGIIGMNPSGWTHWMSVHSKEVNGYGRAGYL